MALWLSAQSDPDAPAVLHRALETGMFFGDTLVPDPAVAFPTGLATWADHPAWGRREVQYVLQLLDRPAAEVRAVIERDWAALTAPGTPRAEVVERYGLKQVPTFRQELLDRGVPPDQLDAIAGDLGASLDATDTEATC